MYASAQGDIEEAADSTRDGTVMLIFGFDGEPATSVHSAFIAAFNAMADKLFLLEYPGRHVYALQKDIAHLRVGHEDYGATKFRTAYIVAFNEMEERLRALRGDEFVDTLFAPIALVLLWPVAQDGPVEAQGIELDGAWWQSLDRHDQLMAVEGMIAGLNTSKCSYGQPR